ncbi:YbaB/EbfC family nucleoid-associated protein [Saccharopolyspora sp. NPDC003752]
MNFGNLQAQMEQALAQITEKQQEMRKVEQDLLSRTATARSKDRMISATVKAGGELAKVEFHDDRYRTMARAELADAVVKVVEQARADMLHQVNETMAPQLGDIADLRGSLGGASPFSEFLAPLMEMQKDVTDSLNPERGNGK